MNPYQHIGSMIRFCNIYCKKKPYNGKIGKHTEINIFYRINRVDVKSEVKDTKVSIEEGAEGWGLIFPWFGKIDPSQIPEKERKKERKPHNEGQIEKMRNAWKSLAAAIKSYPKAVRYEVSVENNPGPHTLALPPTRYEEENWQLESIFLDLDLKSYTRNNTVWALDMFESKKILEDINIQTTLLEEGSTLLELFPEKERNSYKIKLLGPSRHEFHFVKRRIYKDKFVIFLGKILKAFSSSEPYSEKIEIVWEIQLPENKKIDQEKHTIIDNGIRFEDLIDIIKMEFPNLNIPYSSNNILIKNLFENNISKTIYLTKKDSGFERIIELEHQDDHLISIEENYAYLCKNLSSEKCDKDQSLIFVLKKNENTRQFDSRHYTHTPRERCMRKCI